MKAPKGLEGVIVDTTSISNVNAELSQLFYRGEEVSALSESKSFDEVAHLLVYDKLPNTEELEAFQAKEKSGRTLNETTIQLILSLKDAHPMDALRSAVSVVGALDHARAFDNSSETNFDKFLTLYAKIPTIIALHYRTSLGLKPINPDLDLSRSENFFNMCFGKLPSKEVLKGFEVSMTLYAEHSFNASTFSARVITSTTSDMYSAVTGAIGALKGPLHGGANEQVMYVLQELEKEDNVSEWLEKQLKAKRKIMGFGHRVYKNGDSRVPTMQKHMEQLAAGGGFENLLANQKKLAELMKNQKGILPNLDYPAGPSYYMMGFDIPTFTPIFVMSRIVGWSAHIMEQTANNRIIRPLSEYIGK
ncbi:MAG: 2-methylcitrate synthase [Saprospiraceae bacterium]|jgi:2-methylcitrate synthase